MDESTKQPKAKPGEMLSPLQKEQQNRNELTISKENPLLAKTYSVMIRKFPELASIPISSFTEEEKRKTPKSGGRFNVCESGQELIFPTGETHLDEFAFTEDGKPTLDIIASKIGVSTETLLKTKGLIDAFIFLHEGGHAHEYIKSGMTWLEHAEKRKEEIKSLPGGGYTPSRYVALCREQSIPISTDHIRIVSEAYRNLPSEKYSDNFAASLIRENGDELGFHSIT